jgi:DNA polymerase III alpha subunit
VEDNDVPFNFLIEKHVKNYAKDKLETIKTKSIYYNKKEDFKAYLTFRCINNRTTLDKPNLDHMTSDEFCLETL